MSFRDLRLLTENLRVLGYPRTVSLDAFREPNFKLVAELLIWLTSVYEPPAVIPTAVESEHDRITLIKAVAQLFITKQHIKLNTKKLYQADGYAVKELLKLVNSLVEASKASTELDAIVTLENSVQASGLRDLRERVTKITRAGADVHSALGIDMRCRSARHLAAINQLELGEIEAVLREGIKTAEKVTKQSMTKLSNADEDERSIQAKIEKKQKELERNQKRLRQLKQLRPAYQDELDEHEADLKLLYNDYCVKFRNAMYLEQLLEHYRRELPDKTRFAQVTVASSHSRKSTELTTDSDEISIDEGHDVLFPDDGISDEDDSQDVSDDDEDDLATNDDDF